MMSTVTLPLWVLILILLFAAVTFLSHFFLPSVRWFFRRRAERVVARVNTRLARPIEPFKLARRHDMIQRIIYDPGVAHAVSDYATSNNVPEAVAFEKAKNYAREIVPSFSATAYFAVGTRLSRKIARSFYRVRQRALDFKSLESINPDSAIVFVMNHRSNMDYVLVTYLVARASALSYAVGEWARIWPLSSVIRMMGAYFIRRSSRNALYRKVLSRYVQLATEGGVAQAIYPEGGLSLTGGLQPAKLGLLSYIISDWTPEKRDVVFVPVGLNYDRVIEDKFLIAAGESGRRKFSPGVMRSMSITLRHFWSRVRGRFQLLGNATVVFGVPLRLSEIQETLPNSDVGQIAEVLMEGIAKSVPLCSVPLVARAMLSGAHTQSELMARVEQDLTDLAPNKALRPARGVEDIVNDSLISLKLRGIIVENDGRVVFEDDGKAILQYYANSIEHHFATAA